MERIEDIQSGEVRLAAYACGPESAPPVLLVHGYPDNAHVWTGVAAQLAEQFRVYAYDVRGAGQSTRPKRTQDYQLKHLADDMRAVRRALSPEHPVHLVGHDWGSIQAWEPVTADDAQDHFASFTSISGPSLDHAGQMLRNAGASATAQQIAKSWYVGLFHLPAVGQAFWRFGGQRAWLTALDRIEGIADAPPSPSQAADGHHGIKLYRANVIPRLLRPRKQRTAVPVQLIELTRDHFVGAGLLEGLEQIAPNMSRSQLHTGHWAPISHPVELAQAIAQGIANSTRATA